MVKRFLIVYYKPCKKCQSVAMSLHNKIGGDIEPITFKPAGKNKFINSVKLLYQSVAGKETVIAPTLYNPGDYGDVLIVTPIIWGKINAVTRTYISVNRAQLGKTVTTLVGVNKLFTPQNLSTQLMSKKYGISIRGVMPLSPKDFKIDAAASKLNTLINAL